MKVIRTGHCCSYSHHNHILIRLLHSMSTSGCVCLLSLVQPSHTQLLSALFVLPFSRRAYRLVNMVLMGSFWSLLVWLVDGWGRLKVRQADRQTAFASSFQTSLLIPSSSSMVDWTQVRVFVDKADWDMIGKEHALVIANHRSDVDWVVGWVLAQVRLSTDIVFDITTHLHLFTPVGFWGDCAADGVPRGYPGLNKAVSAIPASKFDPIPTPPPTPRLCAPTSHLLLLSRSSAGPCGSRSTCFWRETGQKTRPL